MILRFLIPIVGMMIRMYPVPMIGLILIIMFGFVVDIATMAILSYPVNKTG